MKRNSYYILLLTMAGQLFSQQLYPDLNGQELIDQLRADYKPAVVLSYDTARDTMFARIDNINGNVSCVYSGYTIYIDPANDPSADAYNKDMNTEHTWPQSMGADIGNANSDLHHLFPCRMQVNSSRGNDPFAEIPDGITDTWWRLDYSLTSIPTSNIDLFSEKDNNGYFEPREDHKGNVARAIFYFYTMYREQSDTNFFNAQKETLRQWNLLDAVDQPELDRSQLIATYQSDRENPFVLDTSLVRRAYFSGSSGSGGDDTTATGEPGEIVITEIMQNPNTVYDADGEWFEIYNSSDHAININEWTIRDNDTDQHQIVTGGSLIIPAGEYLVLGRNADNASNGGVDIAYQYSGIDLANGADEIVLIGVDGLTEMDRVEYDGGPNWPDPTGASMALSDLEADNSSPFNWTVSDLTWDGSTGDFGSPGYSDIAAGIEDQISSLPQSFVISNFPNPFNPNTTINYSVPFLEGIKGVFSVKLIVYNLLGQKVRTWENRSQEAGVYELEFNGNDLPSGIYFVQLSTPLGLSVVHKMVLMK